MRKPATGEPRAGKSPARFGGRGGCKPFPTSMGKGTADESIILTQYIIAFLRFPLLRCLLLGVAWVADGPMCHARVPGEGPARGGG